jgi:predicted nucleic acid-binding Zn ribbon protein
MPIYEYICQDCGEKYDKFVRSSLAKIEVRGGQQCGSLRTDWLKHLIAWRP